MHVVGVERSTIKTEIVLVEPGLRVPGFLGFEDSKVAFPTAHAGPDIYTQGPHHFVATFLIDIHSFGVADSPRQI